MRLSVASLRRASQARSHDRAISRSGSCPDKNPATEALYGHRPTAGRLLFAESQLAESHLTQGLFGQILGRIERLALENPDAPCCPGPRVRRMISVNVSKRVSELTDGQDSLAPHHARVAGMGPYRESRVR